jgi:hypothetical protein
VIFHIYHLNNFFRYVGSIPGEELRLKKDKEMFFTKSLNQLLGV